MRIILVLIMVFFIIACTQQANQEPLPRQDPDAAIEDTVVEASELTTFTDTGEDICLEDGKPIVRIFSTTTCPHCTWIKSTVDKVLKEYQQQEKIVAYHWELDIKEDALTEQQENSVPAEEMNVFSTFNPRYTVPTFIFGCRYMRIGNGYERQDNLKAEEAEFRAVIELLIEEADN
jgi:thioredoxin-related protein